MRYALAVLFALALTTPAIAGGWRTHVYIDPLTDKQFTTATLPASGATLVAIEVQCVNSRVLPRLIFMAPIAVRELAVAYRFDEGPVVPRFAFVTSDARTVYPWEGNPAGALAALRKHRRLRVQVFPKFREPFLADFDLTGAQAALRDVRCP